MRLNEVQPLEEPQRSSARATILIADDLPEWRAEVRGILRGRPEWQIIGEACDGLEVVQKASEMHPDLVLLGIGMPVMNGFHAALKIREAAYVPKIVFLTQGNDPELRSADLTIGEEDMSRKETPRPSLLQRSQPPFATVVARINLETFPGR